MQEETLHQMTLNLTDEWVRFWETLQDVVIKIMDSFERLSSLIQNAFSHISEMFNLAFKEINYLESTYPHYPQKLVDNLKLNVTGYPTHRFPVCRSNC